MDEQTKMQSKFYRIYELQRELLSGKEHYEKMLPEYRKFVDIVKGLEESEFYNSMIGQFTSDADSIEKGLENIKRRLFAIELLLSKANENDESKEIVDWFVTMVFTALGIDLTDIPDGSSEE